MFNIKKNLNSVMLTIMGFLVIFNIVAIKETGNYIGISSYDLLTQDTISDNRIATSFVNSNGRATCASNKYFATVVKTLDAAGRVTDEQYFDEFNNPVTLPSGYSEIKYEYSSNSDTLLYYDVQGNLIINSSGYAYVIRSRDDKGRVYQEKYYNIENANTSCSGGYFA